jgi:hypothetical protein
MLLSVERPFAGAFAIRGPRAMSRHRNGLVSALLPASVWNMCKRTIGVPQELGRSCRLRSIIPAGATGTPTPGLSRRRVARWERNDLRQLRYRQAKETKCGGMAAGRHSVLIVPLKLANSTQLEPVEGSEASNHGTVFEKHDECIEIRPACPRNGSG